MVRIELDYGELGLSSLWRTILCFHIRPKSLRHAVSALQTAQAEEVRTDRQSIDLFTLMAPEVAFMLACKHEIKQHGFMQA